MTRINEIQALFINPEDSYAIHYSYLDVDSSDGVFKKIISIHARNLDSSDSREFSIDKYVLKNDIPLDDIEDWLDEVELIVLDDFNSFLREKSSCNFIFFGEDNGQGLILNELERVFEARNSAESNKHFKEIPPSKRKSIFYLFQFDSQDKSVKDFIKLYNQNNLPTGFLTNGGEGACFEKRQFNKVRASVICKIDFIIRLLNSHSSTNPKISENIGQAVDLENLKPSVILKNMNLKSWLWLIGIIGFIFSAGLGLGKFLNTNRVEQLEYELENQKNNHKLRESTIIDSMKIVHRLSIQKLQDSYKPRLDSISRMKENIIKNKNQSNEETPN